MHSESYQCNACTLCAPGFKNAVFFHCSFFRTILLCSSVPLSLFLSIKVVHASAECLKVVLSTKAGSDALARAVHEAGGDESRWCSLLEPFKQQKKKTKVMLMHQSEYSATSKIVVI